MAIGRCESTLISPALPKDEPLPGGSGSNSVTRLPRALRLIAQHRPTMPAPMTATSPAARSARSRSSAQHRDRHDLDPHAGGEQFLHHDGRRFGKGSGMISR
jgi:hypothetical protein